MEKTNIFHAKTKLVDILDGEEFIVLINEQEAREYGINAFDKVSLGYNGQEIVLNADLTNKVVKSGEIGLFKDVYEKYNIPADAIVSVTFTQTNGKAIDALKKAIKGEKLNYKETYAIMKDIADNRFTDTLITYYSAIGFFKKASDYELYEMAKAMAETGEMLHFDGVVADKHCMGGVPGNETTMIMIPLLASLGIKMPKTFSKAITSPAATGECVNVLMDISFSKKEIENLVKKQNTCLVRGGGLDLAPADEKLIKVAYPLSMQSYSRTVVSIMAKKYAMGITHSLIDIPMGPTAKVPDMKTAKRLKKKYEYVGKKLGMKVHVEITKAMEPIGAGIGATLQVREVLRVLQQHELRPMDLQTKALHLASKIIELVGMAKGKKAYELAYQQLKSGAAWKKMQEIIKAQRGKNPNIKSEELELAKFKKEVKAEKDGTVKVIDMKLINLTTRALGAPIDDQGGLYLHKKLGDKVKKNDIIYVMYANQKSKIDMALESLKGKKMYEIR
ncbi:MAG: thymidine phosphorylase [Candidatus Absconditabacteria bacterium]|nr:thymidine phosphorylase [Candidatus Absconditabacteria bacterium]